MFRRTTQPPRVILVIATRPLPQVRLEKRGVESMGAKRGRLPSAITFFFSRTNLSTPISAEIPSAAARRRFWARSLARFRGTRIARPFATPFSIEQIMVQGERPEWDPPRRGKRFELHWPIWYRSASETEWHSGMTENISFSGALIHAKTPAVPATSVVVVIAMPSTPSRPRSCLVGEGRVVRSVAPPSQTEGSAFAVAVTRYRFDRSGQVLDTIRQ